MSQRGSGSDYMGYPMTGWHFFTSSKVHNWTSELLSEEDRTYLISRIHLENLSTTTEPTQIY